MHKIQNPTSEIRNPNGRAWACHKKNGYYNNPKPTILNPNSEPPNSKIQTARLDPVSGPHVMENGAQFPRNGEQLWCGKTAVLRAQLFDCGHQKGRKKKVRGNLLLSWPPITEWNRRCVCRCVWFLGFFMRKAVEQ